MNKKYISVAVFIVLLFLGLVYWAFVFPTATGYVQVEKGKAAETILASGRVVGKGDAVISFNQGGKIAQVVQEGERLEEGQILVSLENDDLNNLVKQREINLQKAEINLERLKGEDLLEAQQSLRQAEAQHSLARKSYEQQKSSTEARSLELLKQAELEAETAGEMYQRKETLYKAEAISQVEYEEARNARDLAESNLVLAKDDYEKSHLELDSARAELVRAEASLAVAQSKLSSILGPALEIARLNLKEAEALLEEARLSYNNSYIKAPSAGYAASVNVEVGETVQAGEPLMRWFPESAQSYVQVEVDEEFAGFVSPGQEAVVSTSAFPGEQWRAEVTRASATIDAARGTFSVKLALDDLVEKLIPDLAVFVEIVIDDLEEAILLERRWIYQEDGLNIVYVEEGGRASRRIVETGRVNEGLSVVLEGLEEGDTVLTDPDLEDGQRVRLSSGGGQ